ncbi:hypothetical protein Hanom_Chr00s190808g01834801 [Helianthus anomalus]
MITKSLATHDLVHHLHTTINVHTNRIHKPNDRNCLKPSQDSQNRPQGVL